MILKILFVVSGSYISNHRAFIEPNLNQLAGYAKDSVACAFFVFYNFNFYLPFHLTRYFSFRNSTFSKLKLWFIPEKILKCISLNPYFVAEVAVLYTEIETTC